MERNKVVLVDRKDNAIGEMEKLLAHQQGELHRAFSVFIFNDKGELLLQQRAANKYHRWRFVDQYLLFTSAVGRRYKDKCRGAVVL